MAPGVNGSLAVGCAVLALGACAIANSPAQNVAYERWGRCDGRITFLATNSSTRQEVVQCLANAGRAGPALPEPVWARPSGGP